MEKYGPAERHYPVMTIAELCALDVKSRAADAAVICAAQVCSAGVTLPGDTPAATTATAMTKATMTAASRMADRGY